jgi:hypothetical protein
LQGALSNVLPAAPLAPGTYQRRKLAAEKEREPREAEARAEQQTAITHLELSSG